MSTWKLNTRSDEQNESSENHQRLHFIADYSSSRKLSFSEVKQALWEHGFSNINCIQVQPFNTLEAGFALQQLALHENVGEDSYFYVNVAPRKDSEKARDNNEGEPFVFAQLESGATVVTTAGGFTLSMVKGEIERLRNIKVPVQGSQFRSRDIFPEAVASIINGDESLLGDTPGSEIIPEPPENRVGYKDGFGNIKTTIRKSEVNFEEGDRILVETSDSEKTVMYQKGIFDVKEGRMVTAPGSSGGENPFLEVVKRGGSAEEEFGKPEVGDKLELRKL